MLSLTDDFIAAAQASGHEPIWLVELPQAYLYLSTHSLSFGRTWRLGEGISLGSGWRIGAVREPYDNRIAENGMGALRRSLDDTGGSSRVSGMSVLLLNHDDYSSGLLTTALDNTRVRLLMGFRGLPYPSYVLLLNGVLDNYGVSLTSLNLDITDDSLRVHRDLSTPIGSQYFPGAPVANRGKAIAILIGRNTDIQAHKVIGNAIATLAYAVTNVAGEVLLDEIGAPFPASGEITLGTESAVTYASRSYQTIGGITYLQLEGLTRAAPVAQNAGDAVTLTSVVHTHLVGYETGDVTAVRAAGVLVSPAGYTVSTDAGSADRPVTLIAFDSEPTEPVTIDTDGRNVDPSTIANGGFESGDTTGWTLGGSGTPTVSTDAPFGLYKLEFVGSEGVDEEIYTDFDTQIGRYYTVELSYKDIQPATNLLTNGGFETGDLTGWTEDASQIDGLAASSYAGITLTNPHTGLPQAYGSAPEGALSLRLGWDGVDTYQGQVTYALYQDVATTVSVNYVFSFAHFGSYLIARGGVYTYWYAKIGYYVASDDDASVYYDVTLDPYRYSGWVETPPLPFTAATTTTRIMLRVEVVFNGKTPVPAYLDNIQLVQASSMPTSVSGVALGTPSDPEAFAAEVLAPKYGWSPVTLSFLATEAQSRVTLRSKWVDQSAPTHFDEVRLHDGGRNPADAIAYVVDNFLPEITRDTASFNTAYSNLVGWQFGGIMADPGDSRARLDDMAWQCNSRLIYSAQGQLKMQVRVPSAGATTPILSTANIVDGTFRMQREPLQNIYTSFTLWFGRTSDTTDTQEGKSFQTSVQATTLSTTHPGAPLDRLCQAAYDAYGVSQRLERRADMIRDLSTAHLLLKALVERHTQRQYDIEVRVFHSIGVGVEEGDSVAVSYSRLYGGVLWLCKVLSKEIGPTDVALQLRTQGRFGFYEPWDFPLIFTEGQWFVEPWDA